MEINKLLGFYELRDSSLPSVPWKEYTPEVTLDDDKLWTIRSAIFYGNDFNLPRSVGKGANESKKFADELYKQISIEKRIGNKIVIPGRKGMVIYYPYFVAKISGTLQISLDSFLIEAVKGDLWNLVTDQKLDASIEFSQDGTITSKSGNASILDGKLIDDLKLNAKKVKSFHRDDLLGGSKVLAEWSYAQNCGVDGNPTGDPYLVFYEIRTI